MVHAKGIEIAGRAIGPDQPPYVIAELSANHNGDLERAFAIMAAAKAAGADALKLQTYTADTLTIDHDSDLFRIKGGLWDGYTLYKLYQEASTPWEWQEALFAKGRELGIAVFSSPFDETAIDLLEQLGAPAYKIASFEATDHALVARAAATGKPLIISTGMCNEQEIAETVEVARRHGNGELILLHCISAYPAPAEDFNLGTIPYLAEKHGLIVGLSDHTLGTIVAVAAVALGAAVIEKHFTLSRTDGGHDAPFSLEPQELSELVSAARTAFGARGGVRRAVLPVEAGNVKFRRSLFVVRDMAQGEPFATDTIRSIRPGYGLAPKHLPSVLGRRAARALKCGTPLDWDMIAAK